MYSVLGSIKAGPVEDDSFFPVSLSRVDIYDPPAHPNAEQ